MCQPLTMWLAWYKKLPPPSLTYQTNSCCTSWFLKHQTMTWSIKLFSSPSLPMTAEFYSARNWVFNKYKYWEITKAWKLMPRSTREKGQILVIPALQKNNRCTEIGLLAEDHSKSLQQRFQANCSVATG